MSKSIVLDSGYKLYKDDAVEWLKGLDSDSIELLITDPPYESLEKHRKIGTTTRLSQSKRSSNLWFEIFPNNRFLELFTEIYRILRKNSHFYLFCDQETAFYAKPIAELAGFTFWKPLVWDKNRIGMGYHYRARYEFILFFEKGKRRLNDLSIPDVLNVPRVVGAYPTEKPTQLLEILIKQSSIESELICDPFMGSGSTGEATLKLNRRFIGNDKSADAFSIASKRLEKL